MSAGPRPTRRSHAPPPAESARASGEICLPAVVVSSEDSLFRRCRDQEISIAGLIDDRRQLREENADLLAQLEVGRRPRVVADGIDRLEATLPAGPAAPATARAALTRWLSGNLPVDVLEDARLLASELVASSLL